MELTSEDAALLLIISENIHLKLKRERSGFHESIQSRGHCIQLCSARPGHCLVPAGTASQCNTCSKNIYFFGGYEYIVYSNRIACKTKFGVLLEFPFVTKIELLQRPCKVLRVTRQGFRKAERTFGTACAVITP